MPILCLSVQKSDGGKPFSHTHTPPPFCRRLICFYVSICQKCRTLCSGVGIRQSTKHIVTVFALCFMCRYKTINKTHYHSLRVVLHVSIEDNQQNTLSQFSRCASCVGIKQSTKQIITVFALS